jgi:hypothetical protein
MENTLTRVHQPVIQKAFGSFLAVVTRKQTYLNLAYLLAGSACGLIDLLLLAAAASLVFGLVAVPLGMLAWLPLGLGSALKLAGLVLGGLFVVPLAALLCFLPSVLEQNLAAWFLKMDFMVKPFWLAEKSPVKAAAKYIGSAVAWKRLSFCTLRVPLGYISFLAMLIFLPAFFGMLSMPVVYLAGFHELIFWNWRVDTFMGSLVVSLAGMLLAPLILHLLNWLARFSGWLARELLPG